MVYIQDEGSTFEAPIEVVWKYLQTPEEHTRTHKNRRFQQKAVGENVMELSWEGSVGGSWVPMRTRITALPPVGVAIEMVEGPMAGSKFFNIYTPMGARTGVSVFGEFTSKTIPPAQLEAAVRGFLEQVYHEDAAALRAMASQR